MPGQNFTQDDYIEQFGTEEQKADAEKRRKALEEWVSQFPIMTVEEAMKDSFNMDKFK